MIRIVEGITDDDFIANINSNFDGIGTTLTLNMSGAEVVSVLNSNFAILNSIYNIELNQLYEGIPAAEFTIAINSNFNEIIVNKYIYAIENDATLPIILTTQEKEAVSQLVVELIDNNLWSKYFAFYPFTTNSKHACKYNLIDPRDLDAAFRITFPDSGAFHFQNGLWSKNTGFNIHLVPSTVLDKTNYHISFYNFVRTDVNPSGYYYGCSGGGAYVGCLLNNNNFRVFMDTDNELQVTVDSKHGHFFANIKDGRKRLFKNGIRQYDAARGTIGALPTGELYIHQTNPNNGSSEWKSQVFTIGLGFTDEEVLIEKQIIDRFNTALGRYDTYDYNLRALVDKGNFTPTTTSNPLLEKYHNFKVGAGLSYGLYTYQYLGPYPQSPNLFYKGTHDVDKWVSDAKNAGVEYMMHSLYDNSQFALFDNPIPFPDYLINQMHSYRKFDLKFADCDYGLTDRLFEAGYKYDMEIIPYMCSVWGANTTMLDWVNAKNVQGGFTETDFLYFNNHFAAIIQYIISRWKPNYFWIDVAGATTSEMARIFYNAAKSMNPNIQVISNSIGDIALDYFPYDIASNEEFFSLRDGTQTWDQVLSPYRTKDGITYYIPQEIVTNIFYGGKGVSYFWTPTIGYRSLGEIQSIYDIAKAHSVPFMLNMAPNRMGVVEQTQLDLFTGIIR